MTILKTSLVLLALSAAPARAADCGPHLHLNLPPAPRTFLLKLAPGDLIEAVHFDRDSMLVFVDHARGAERWTATRPAAGDRLLKILLPFLTSTAPASRAFNVAGHFEGEGLDREFKVNAADFEIPARLRAEAGPTVVANAQSRGPVAERVDSVDAAFTRERRLVLAGEDARGIAWDSPNDHLRARLLRFLEPYAGSAVSPIVQLSGTLEGEGDSRRMVVTSADIQRP